MKTLLGFIFLFCALLSGCKPSLLPPKEKVDACVENLSQDDDTWDCIGYYVSTFGDDTTEDLATCGCSVSGRGNGALGGRERDIYKCGSGDTAFYLVMLGGNRYGIMAENEEQNPECIFDYSYDYDLRKPTPIYEYEQQSQACYNCHDPENVYIEPVISMYEHRRPFLATFGDYQKLESFVGSLAN